MAAGGRHADDIAACGHDTCRQRGYRDEGIVDPAFRSRDVALETSCCKTDFLGHDFSFSGKRGDPAIAWAQVKGIRSEEHTSELQSLMRISYAVFCLKKKKYTNTNYSQTHNISDAREFITYHITHNRQENMNDTTDN